MSLTNDQQMQADAAGFISEFGEPVTYFSCDDNGNIIAQATIQIVVNRNPPAAVQEDGKVLADDVQLSIANDINLGIATVNPRRDKVLLSGRYGGAEKMHTITTIISGDAGVWELRAK